MLGHRVPYLGHGLLAQNAREEVIGVVEFDVDHGLRRCVRAYRDGVLGEVRRDAHGEVVATVRHTLRGRGRICLLPLELHAVHELGGEVITGVHRRAIFDRTGVLVDQSHREVVHVLVGGLERPQVEGAVDERDEEHHGHGNFGQLAAFEPAKFSARG